MNALRSFDIETLLSDTIWLACEAVSALTDALSALGRL